MILWFWSLHVFITFVNTILEPSSSGLRNIQFCYFDKNTCMEILTFFISVEDSKNVLAGRVNMRETEITWIESYNILMSFQYYFH